MRNKKEESNQEFTKNYYVWNGGSLLPAWCVWQSL